MNRSILLHVDLSVKLRRYLAWVVDWIIIFAAVIFLAAVLHTAIYGEDEMSDAFGVGMILVILAVMAFRDPLFGGKSPGKRIFRLGIVDAESGGRPARLRSAFRGILYPLSTIEGLVLIACGHTLGDILGCTAVVDIGDARSMWLAAERRATGSRAAYPMASAQYPSPYVRHSGTYVLNGVQVTDPDNAPETVQGSVRRRGVAAVAVGVIVIAVVIICIVFGVLNGIKSSEQYTVAFEYLVNSEYFRSTSAAEDDVKLSGYSHRYTSKEESTVFTFRINGKTVEVYCHREAGIWIACDDCSRLGVRVPNTNRT